MFRSWFLALAVAAISPTAAAEDAAAPLAAYDFGDYAGLASRPNPDRYSIVFTPALVAVLLAAEQGNGGPLTEAQVQSLRDRAGAMAVPAESAQALVDGRAYKDLDPEYCWQEWQAQRQELIKP